ncbi:hypothetical protein HZU40_24590 [Mycolicibacterium fluoranthenivorans]|uniref:Uncharacterized protein n=1 Tax=Mycolicibacterium fluoranthenivorans TaxID=258505 RepID=A0A7G8PAJ0_9MYCO|nr:hypothetical protein [Mycolicibacterium fluoranthenivorans]QNJ91356.1 hypothetical protein HZU40_24590 [Mycolicibacterium fluoranthenivorans]
MSSSDVVAVVIAGLGILGTLGGTLLAQRGEARRADRAQLDALRKERREIVRAHYQEILQFVAEIRTFVLEMRSRLVELEEWSARASSDAREVEDLEARAHMLRTRCIKELPAVQALASTSAPDDVVVVFDEIARIWPEVVAGMSVALHFKVGGRRQKSDTESEVGRIDHFLGLLGQARELLRTDLLPDDEGKR